MESAGEMQLSYGARAKTMANDPLNLDEAAEWAGIWWLPDDPDERIAGVLRYEPETGLALSLIGAFEDRIMSSLSPGVVAVHEGTLTWEVIHGAAEQREITLLGCVPTRTRRTIGARVKSPDRQIVKATTALIGAHVRGQGEAAFSAAEVSVEDLELWAASSVFEGSWGTTGGKPDGSGRISVKPVGSESVTVDGTEFRLTHRRTLPFLDQLKGGTVGRMRDTVFVRVVPSQPFSLTVALEAAGSVQDLIALATHQAAGVIWLRLELAEIGAASPADRPALHRSVDVLYAPPALGKHDAKAVEHHRVFFTCESIPFETIVPRWGEARGRLRAATNMIMGLRYAPARYIESNLLTAVGAAEVLHRGLGIDEGPFPPDVFDTMRGAMLAQVPEEHRDRLKGSIRNEPTLRDRLLALAARPDQEAIGLLMPDVDRWARRTTRARNDLAHEGTTPGHSFEELFAVVEVTTAVVILNVMQELGLPAERQRAIVQEHPQLRATARAAREWLVSPGSGA
ncbi:HEPN domain-containing protein [Cellulomonas sp. KRMCY2]|uniref:ApeA N-terminal domain 1-containing protein n=1 Tax=Cellulomonas sp. KRMCY2 TaxID=1304865 RepID=UPI001E3C061D|nr:HEPN domain-containing protein [Cellulomonas sp. KRMCY2]